MSSHFCQSVEGVAVEGVVGATEVVAEAAVIEVHSSHLLTSS
jgi:hypothetical protein